MTPYQGQITYGIRNGVGGENAKWGINPATGQEEPVFGGYLFSDLLKEYGSVEAIRDHGALKPYSPEWLAAQPQDNLDEFAGSGPYAADMARFSARQSNDTFSGKDGLQDLIKIASMAGAAYGGGALTGGEAAGATGATGGGLGSGLTSGTTAGGIGGGATGTGLTAGTTAGGIGAGATGTGIAGATGAAGTSLAPGFFASEALPAAAATTAASTLAPTGGTSGGPAIPGSALEGILRGLPAAFGAIGSKQQADAYKDLADKYMAIGAPSRARYEGSFAPGFTMENDPGYKDALDQSAKATLHGLSVTGNPAGSPNAWSSSLSDLYQKTAYPALKDYRTTNAGAGGMTTLTAAAPAAANSGINADANIYNAVGAGAADIFNPKPSLAEIFKQLRTAGAY